MNVEFGREICGNLNNAETREWLVTNGIGGYASGTVAGLLTRRYHGLLVAALNPPLDRTLLLTKLDEIAVYENQCYALHANRWVDDIIEPQGFHHIESFALAGTIPTWRFAFSDALLEKQIWMHQGENTTYVQYTLRRATQPLQLKLKALVNYRDHHGSTQGNNWTMSIAAIPQGICVQAHPEAHPIYLLSDQASAIPTHEWYYNFELAIEKYRGLSDREHHLHAATFEAVLQPNTSVTFVASTEQQPNLDGAATLLARHHQEQSLINLWHINQPKNTNNSYNYPAWIEQLVLAADQFIVDRPISNTAKGKTIMAGYHWFGDWGRDTMISLPGLTITTGRSDIARSILCTFAQYVDRGMLPNRFPDAGEVPEYNTVDATLWYFEAIRSYYNATADKELLKTLFPVLSDIIDWHQRGNRYNIHLDTNDGLLYAGAPDVQLTWMDAKVDNWVVTPRQGKPIEVNALWYCALRTMAEFARQLGKPHQDYDASADRTLANFSRFWNRDQGYCYDVLDSPEGHDDSFRPNQIFAISLPGIGAKSYTSLLTPLQQQKVVDACGRLLLTSHGLRSLAPHHLQYQGQYGGNSLQRDGAYHQGTVWGWLLGPFVLAHLQVYGDSTQAQQFLAPIANHLLAHGLGTCSEIFDGNAPMNPRGCIAQAWTVAEVLRAWTVTSNF